MSIAPISLEEQEEFVKPADKILAEYEKHDPEKSASWGYPHPPSAREGKMSMTEDLVRVEREIYERVKNLYGV